MRNFITRENTLSRQKHRPFAMVLAWVLISFVFIAENQAQASSMSLQDALATDDCLKPIPKSKTNPAVPAALYIDASTPCSDVTISTPDATFTAEAPLIPVVIGSGGILTFQDQPMTLYASSFLIHNSGILQAGSATAPIQNKITIVMAGSASASQAPQADGKTPIANTSNAAANSRDITVDGGVLQLYGGKGLSATPDGTNNNPVNNPAFINTQQGTKSWTYLSAPAGPSNYNDNENVSAPVPVGTSATTLSLATTVDWQIGDWVSVATTGFSSHQTEIVQVCGVTQPGTSAPGQGSQLSLCPNSALKHYHYGGLAPTPGFFPANTKQSVVPNGNPIDVSLQAKSFYDSSERNYGIDERAEVALLSRNIKLSSLAGQDFTGGHLAVLGNNSSVQLVGVEIEKFGQPFVGRYPVHLHHMMGGGSQALIQDVSVHHSYNKCFTIHGTGNADLYNNVCVRTVGQGMYLEDGDNITGNQFIRNFISGAMAANTTYSYPQQPGNSYWDGDNLQNYRNQAGNITNATNTSPIVITSTQTLATGEQVTISGVQGNIAANGTWTVTNISANTFSLNGSTGNGTYTKGGTWGTADANWYTINSIPDTSASGANGSLGPDLYHPGGFWITNLGNTFVNNSVAGCQAQGRGYWLLPQNQASTSTNQFAYPEFTGNRVHGCYNGIDTQPDAVNALDPKPTMNYPTNAHAPVFLLNDNTVTRSRQRGFWGRGIFFALHNNRFATNPYGFSLLGGGGPEGNLPGFWGMAHENVIAGMTRNNVERYPGCALGAATNATTWQTECTDVAWAGKANNWGNYPSPNMNIQGYSYYDGPARIEHNRFVNFRHDPTGIYPNDPAARLLTQTDIGYISSYASQGQLEGPIINASGAAPNSAPSINYQGYAGDPATGWIQSNQQIVPPTQYIRNSIWENVDFKHQVYTAAVNMGPFNDGDKNTVILDRDSQLSGYRVAPAKKGVAADGMFPISLNNLEYFATDFTIDEPHSRGINNFRASSLMSPHKYSTLNIESVENSANTFRVEIKRDMPVYGDTNYPSQFLNGRGQNQIYEPFVMDRMGYTVYGKTGIENKPATQVPTQFMNRLLFSYTDPAVKKDGEYFVNRIAVRQHVTNLNEIKVYRIRRQWGQQYINTWPAGYNPPGPAANTCDGIFFENQGTAATRWQDCLARANNQTPPQSYPGSPSTYSGGITLKRASSWKAFEQSYKNLLAGKTKSGKAFSVADFINSQTFYYDAKNHLLYFYMIEDQPVQQLPSPYGTCGGGQQQYAANVQSTQQIKNFSDPNSVQAALDASCLASNGVPQPTDLFACGTNGCAAYMVDFTAGNVVSPSASTSSVPAHPISRQEYSTWNQYKLVYSTPSQQPNGLPVVANPAIGNTAPPTDGNDLADIMVPLSGQSPIQGNQISYSFLPLTGSPIPLTQNFPYRCVTTPPWSPVNARGAYLANGGSTYPISNSVCMELDALYQRYTTLTGKKQASERFKIKKQIIELSKQIVKQ